MPKHLAVDARFTPTSMVIFGEGMRLFVPNGTSLELIADWCQEVARATRLSIELSALNFDPDEGAVMDDEDDAA